MEGQLTLMCYFSWELDIPLAMVWCHLTCLISYFYVEGSWRIINVYTVWFNALGLKELVLDLVLMTWVLVFYMLEGINKGYFDWVFEGCVFMTPMGKSIVN